MDTGEIFWSKKAFDLPKNREKCTDWCTLQNINELFNNACTNSLQLYFQQILPKKTDGMRLDTLSPVKRMLFAIMSNSKIDTLYHAGFYCRTSHLMCKSFSLPKQWRTITIGDFGFLPFVGIGEEIDCGLNIWQGIVLLEGLNGNLNEKCLPFFVAAWKMAASMHITWKNSQLISQYFHHTTTFHNPFQLLYGHVGHFQLDFLSTSIGAKQNGTYVAVWPMALLTAI